MVVLVGWEIFSNRKIFFGKENIFKCLIVFLKIFLEKYFQVFGCVIENAMCKVSICGLNL